MWLRAPWSRLLWTAGCLANLAHVLLAMHIVYAWDHELAYAAVARQTYEQTGFNSGIGLFINYAFSALWLLDTLSWWLIPVCQERRPRWLDGGLQLIFLFMFFNATVVFGKSAARLPGAILCAVGTLGWMAGRARVLKTTPGLHRSA